MVVVNVNGGSRWGWRCPWKRVLGAVCGIKERFVASEIGERSRT
ncbi:hypothetical protein [Pyrobaculum calidifontis]|nr:hypothetical protein [Pyrobaculum calidifontis]